MSHYPIIIGDGKLRQASGSSDDIELPGNLKLNASGNHGIYFGDGEDNEEAAIYWTGNNLILHPRYAGGSGAGAGNLYCQGDVFLQADDRVVYFGSGPEASIFFSSDPSVNTLVINPNIGGGGFLKILCSPIECWGVGVGSAKKPTTDATYLIWFTMNHATNDPSVFDGTSSALYQKLRTICVKDGDGIVSTVKDIYGSMYADHANGAGYTIGIAAANTDYEVDGGWTTGSVLQGTTFPDDHYVLVSYAGTYLITWSMSVETDESDNSIEAGIMVNGSAQAAGASLCSTLANIGNTVSGTAIIALSANDQISLYVNNRTKIKDIEMEKGSLSVMQVGE